MHSANKLDLPVLVFFGITSDFPEANERHYVFMLQGLQEVKKELDARGIPFIIQAVSPEQGAVTLSRKAALLVVDRGYLRLQQQWRAHVAAKASCPVIQVESDVVIPVEAASHKEEYSAATLRRKINRLLPSYLVPLEHQEIIHGGCEHCIESLDLHDITGLLKITGVKNDVKTVTQYRGGNVSAHALLDDFINNKLKYYDSLRNDPSRDYLSHLGPYLHFGQISPLYIALRIMQTPHSAKSAFLEELIVRRELSMNFVFYNKAYDSFMSLPEWAKNTLHEHAADTRPYLYSLNDMENFRTHDSCWNAAQKEMVITGKMHGYMRMYWGKKIMEWSPSPEEAHARMVYLNNKYSLDGRDPNSFTGIAWCFGKHDRPWKERPVFGSVRYMNEAGLRRKFNMDSYINSIEQL